tara:strand:- start:119 stop:406 length:288 start_codon:yes stop_codon:yes gene_type:complete
MRKLWLIYAIVSVADLVLSGLYLNPSLEANPVAAWIWSTFGYSGLAAYKSLVIYAIVYPSCKYIERKNKTVAKAILCFAILATSITCLLFGAILL